MWWCVQLSKVLFVDEYDDWSCSPIVNCCKTGVEKPVLFSNEASVNSVDPSSKSNSSLNSWTHSCFLISKRYQFKSYSLPVEAVFTKET